ncbi:unnamed protein product [Didymodactylos carnosus]|uniref:NAD(P)(+)--arginine ADP-ribosyltransferase n=1 Tax=Didymodactylos carnosus TaxID=1234261 RepID=A0A8S2J0F7_9BILA|nr:unnamed protein product [Didymodactylos carnosus]CAF3772659.1 unnamed protein product [Didymodactylos carnosus]
MRYDQAEQQNQDQEIESLFDVTPRVIQEDQATFITNEMSDKNITTIRPNIRRCRLRLWSNYEGFGFSMKKTRRSPFLIDLIWSNSPASVCGLKIGDCLLKVNRQCTQNLFYEHVLQAIKYSLDHNHFVDLLVYSRHQNPLNIDEQMVALQETPLRMPADCKRRLEYRIPRVCLIEPGNYGFELVRGPDETGTYVQDVTNILSGLRNYDSLIEINGENVEHRNLGYIVNKLKGQRALFSKLASQEDCNTYTIVIYAKKHLTPFSNDQQISTRSRYFCRFDDCIDYITRNLNEKIALVIFSKSDSHLSGYIFEKPEVFALSQIDCIYLLSHDSSKYYSSDCQNICLFLDQNVLLDELKKDITKHSQAAEIHLDRITEISLRTVTTHHFHLLTELVSSMPQSQQSKTEMLNECRLHFHYKSNEAQLRMIDDFEHSYTSDQAIWWYTKPGFLFTQLNRACRTQEIDEIYAFRYFISDLNDQLTQLHGQQDKEHKLPYGFVYRGQSMSKNELNSLTSNVKKLFATNAFFSTTKNYCTALVYAIRRTNYEAVVFVIEISETVKNITKPFADISQISAIEDEEEVLFSIGTVFRLDNFQQLADGTWIVEMSLSKEDDDTLKNIIEPYQKLIDETPIFLLMGEFLLQIGEPEKAERYYRIYIEQDTTENSFTIARVYEKIADVCIKKCEYASALENYELALTKYLETLPTNDPIIKKTYDKVGYVYLNYTHEYRRAVRQYSQDLYKVPLTDRARQAIIYYWIGNMYYELGYYVRALTNYNRAIILGYSSDLRMDEKYRICRKYPITSPKSSILCPPGSQLPEATIRDLTSSIPTIIAGDFNAKSPSWCCTSHNIKGRQMKQMCEDLGLQISQINGPTSRRSSNVIDLICCSEPLETVSRINYGTSDHRPVSYTGPWSTSATNVFRDYQKFLITCSSPNDPNAFWRFTARHFQKANVHIKGLQTADGVVETDPQTILNELHAHYSAHFQLPNHKTLPEASIDIERELAEVTEKYL